MTATTRLRHRAAGALLLGALLTATGCTDTGSNAEETSQAAPPSAPSNASDGSTSPEDRVAGYFEAFDAAAEEGWQDTSYNAEYLTPDLAEKADAADAENRDSGATFEGERQLSDWTVLEQEETSVVVEFCQDTSEQRVMRDGEDQGEAEGAEVGRFTLTRESADDPWLIAEKGFYPEETTCAEHFAD